MPYVIFMVFMLGPKIMLLDIDAEQQIIDVLMFRASWFVVVIGVLQIIYTCLIRIKADLLFVSLATIILFGLGYFIQVNYDDFYPLLIITYIYSPKNYRTGSHFASIYV